MVLVNHLRDVFRKIDLLQKIKSCLAVLPDNRHFGVAESTRTREYLRRNRQLAEIVNSRSQFDRVDLSGLKLELGSHRSCNLRHSVLMSCGIRIPHLDRGRQSAYDCSAERCLTLLQLLSVGDVDNNNGNPSHMVIHPDGVEIRKPIVDVIRVHGGLAGHLLANDWFTGVDHPLVYRLESGPQCRNNFSHSPSDLVFDLPAMH